MSFSFFSNFLVRRHFSLQKSCQDGRELPPIPHTSPLLTVVACCYQLSTSMSCGSPSVPASCLHSFVISTLWAWLGWCLKFTLFFMTWEVQRSAHQVVWRMSLLSLVNAIEAKHLSHHRWCWLGLLGHSGAVCRLLLASCSLLLSELCEAKRWNPSPCRGNVHCIPSWRSVSSFLVRYAVICQSGLLSTYVIFWVINLHNVTYFVA